MGAIESAVAAAATPGRTSAAPLPRCLVCEGRLDASPLGGLRRCADCGFVTTATDLDATDFAALYGRDYFHGSEYLDYVEERESLRLNFANRMSTLKEITGGLRGKSLFEIGCAYGFFLELAREHGVEASGVDTAAEAVRYAQDTLGVRAECGDYLALQTDPVDLIAMWDTVEHLPRPDLFIEKAAADLRPGGLIAITTGDIGSLNARMRGRYWRMIHPPTHLHYFSVVTLSRLLVRHGLDVVHVTHPGVSRRLHSILYLVLAHRLQARGLCRVATRMLPNLPVTLNLFDIMFVVARKRAGDPGGKD
jgi:2-polyprenyl-3-methyl-5-hydroxy-6-metoxy-1,4-benzoquinol methylase